MSAAIPTPKPIADPKPLADLDQWDDFVGGRYKEGRSQAEFRQYDAAALPGVAEFYRLNHERQTVSHV